MTTSNNDATEAVADLLNDDNDKKRVIDVPFNARDFVSHVIQAEITGSRTKTESNSTKQYTAFVVTVSSGKQRYDIERRYSEFLTLYNKLSAFFERALSSSFPQKTLFEKPLSEEVITHRKRTLQRFLNSVFGHQLMFASESVQQFLGLTEKLGAPQQKGVFVAKYGEPRVAQYGKVPRPILFARNEPILVLVKVHAAALTPLDVKVRAGEARLILPYQLPLVLGQDFSGEVVACGAAVKDVKVGDAVFGRLDDRAPGAMAEYLLVAAPLLAKKPDNVTFVEAASFGSVATTAHQALVDEAKLEKDQTVFIAGGETALGSFAIQYASKVLGAKVTTSCAKAHIERCQSLGADTVIDSDDSKALETVRDLDVGFDPVGSDVALWAVKKGGVCVSAATHTPTALSQNASLGVPRYVRWMVGASNALTLAQAKARRVEFKSVVTRSSGDVLRGIIEAVRAGNVKPVVDRVYPLDQIGDAMSYANGAKNKRPPPGAVIIDVLSQGEEKNGGVKADEDEVDDNVDDDNVDDDNDKQAAPAVAAVEQANDDDGVVDDDDDDLDDDDLDDLSDTDDLSDSDDDDDDTATF